MIAPRGPELRRFTVQEYHRMAEAGVFDRGGRVELLRGAIIAMAPTGPAHATIVDRLTERFVVAFRGRACVRIQNPIRLDDESEPEPDVAVVRGSCAGYASAHPGPSDVLFLVEVAESSLRYDREDKLPAYARAGVREVWLIDVAARRLEVHTQPGSEGYARIAILRGTEEVAAEAVPELRFVVSDLLG